MHFCWFKSIITVMDKPSPLVLNSLTKRFGKNRGIEDVSLELSEGEVFGFLGPNGAGKSTTIRLIMDFIKPSAGEVWLLGETTVEGRTSRHGEIGYLSGDLALYEKMTGRALLNYLSGLGKTVDWSYVENLARKFDASLDRPIKTLSKGNRQKIGIIQAFMHQPKILILDEPTSGLDPLMKQVFYDVVEDVSKTGSTVFVSSHDLAEVQKICNRAGFIREGKLIAVESVAGALHLATHRYIVSLGKKLNLSEVKKLSSVETVEKINDEYVFTVRGNVTEFIKFIADYDPLVLSQSEVELEEMFMHYYTDKEAD